MSIFHLKLKIRILTEKSLHKNVKYLTKEILYPKIKNSSWITWRLSSSWMDTAREKQNDPSLKVNVESNLSRWLHWYEFIVAAIPEYSLFSTPSRYLITHRSECQGFLLLGPCVLSASYSILAYRVDVQGTVVRFSLKRNICSPIKYN